MHPSFGRYTEPLPSPSAPAPLRLVLVLVAILLTFILGGAVVFFLLTSTPYLDALKPDDWKTKPRQTSPLPEPSIKDLNIPKRLPTPAPPRLQQHLEPQEAEIPEIKDLLRTGYIEPGTILLEELDQESLQHLLTAPDRFVRLSREPALEPFRAARPLIETLPSGIAYWRPMRFSPVEIQSFARQWSVWKSRPAPGLIIDLRYFRDGNNFAGAASAAGLFLPPDTPLFSIQDLDQPQQVFRTERQPLEIPRNFPILFLIHEWTRGAGEVLVECMRQQPSCLLLGQSTAGEGGLYTETRLRSGRYLRLATEPVILADGTTLLGRPVHPHLTLPVPPGQGLTVFQAAYQSPLKKLVAEPSIPKQADTSAQPDIDEALKQTDALLQTARDMIIAITSQRRGLPTLIEFEAERSRVLKDQDAEQEN